MAAFMRGVTCLVSAETHVFLTKRTDIIVESIRYVRGLRRKPVRVLFPENEAGKVVRASPEKTPVTPAADLQGRDSQPTGTHAQGHGRDQVDGLRFERAFAGDKRLARLVSVARSRTFREHQGKILLEGRRLICDALDAGASPQIVFFSTVDRLRELPLDKLRRATLVKVKFEDIKIWSDLVAPQGVIAIFSRPDPSRLKFANRGQSVPLSLICDNIRDPGNLGTMVRCAAAAGCSNVLLTKGCVDVWEPKVLRAAMGAHFRLPIYPSLDWDDVEKHLPQQVIVHVAESRGETEHHASPELSKAGEYGWVSSRPNRKKVRYEEYDSSSDSESEDEGFSHPEVDTKLYHDTWAQSPSALVIGGETQGLSLEAVQLAGKTDGNRLFIPIVPDVDSLNSAMAASILLFEGRRQLLKLLQTSGKKRQPKAERQSS
ncbi:rRNA methyltransferase 3A, mitochondrial [Cololabis saira]|uniref:rRNA methyltransferase 3A, mitochondrial n=1 Tax=Cololabis saira TaxID=129043 RepID=UPI002AD272DC|nr:rRNA methyltransferase 3A, mitochondrial [Cololabis saira]